MADTCPKNDAERARDFDPLWWVVIWMVLFYGVLIWRAHKEVDSCSHLVCPKGVGEFVGSECVCVDR